MPPRPYNSFARLHDGVYRFVRGGDGPSSQGMHVAVAGGVHGNERIGVKVLDRLRLALFGVSPLSLATNTTAFPVIARGASLTLVYGNPRAIRTGTRGSEPHRDLNRCFPADLLAQDASVHDSLEEQRARELAPLLAASDLLLDLHSTNKPSVPFVRVAGFASGIPARLSAITDRLPCDIVLHDPRHLIGDGHVALTDEFVGVHGGLGVCFESGLASDLSDAKVDAITRGVVDILTQETQAVELVDGASGGSSRVVSVDVDTLEDSSSQRQVFEITQVFKLSERGFRWADGVGQSNFQLVPANQPLGFVGAEPFVVAYDAYIVFPKVPALWELGA